MQTSEPQEYNSAMQIFLTCGICGDQLRASGGRGLMNRIKMLIHIEKCHPERIADFREALRTSNEEPLPAFATTLKAA
jgi:hypothetical protein